MKTYKIVLFTPNGIKTEIYRDTEPLKCFEEKMTEKYKTFIMQQAMKF